MSYACLNQLAREARNNLPEAPGDKKPHRRRRDLDLAVNSIYETLRASVRMLAHRKSMADHAEEVQQHACVAIVKALETWDEEKASFSTHVHWLIRAELATLHHQLFPERRKVKTITPVHVVSLEQPCSDDDEDVTLHGLIKCDGAEEAIEDNMHVYTVLHRLERVFSHYMAKKEQQAFRTEARGDRVRKFRLGLMRNRDMYIRRRLNLETYESIALDYDITRERVRQIIKKQEDDLRGAVPRLSSDKHSEEGGIVDSFREPPASIHPSWMMFVCAFHEDTGRDPRLIDRHIPLPPHVLVEETFQEEVAVAIIPDAAGIPSKVEDVARPVLPPPSMDPLPILTRKRPAVQLALALGGALLAAASPAAAQSSRAIPPKSAEAAVGQEVAPEAPAPARARTGSGKREAIPTARRAAPSENPNLQVPAAAAIRTANPSWGVIVANYGSRAEVQQNWFAKRREWNWIRGLYPAFVQTGPHFQLMFGPLTQGQAQGLCHEARRGNRPCAVAEFGRVRTAAATPRPAAQARRQAR